MRGCDHRKQPANNPPVRRQLRAKTIRAVEARNTIGQAGDDTSAQGALSDLVQHEWGCGTNEQLEQYSCDT